MSNSIKLRPTNNSIRLRPTENKINVRIVPTETTISYISMVQAAVVKSEVK